MKKIFTIFLAAGTISFASAQTNGPKGNSYKDKNENKYSNTGYTHPSAVVKNKQAHFAIASFSFNEKEVQIQRINREYDRQVAAIKRNRYVTGKEQSQQIRKLEFQRNQEISQVQSRFERINRSDTDNVFAKNNPRKW